MNTVNIIPHDISVYLEVFDDVIKYGQMQALNGDWYKLRCRLDRLSRQVAVAEAGRASPRPSDWAYRLEHEIWLRLLTEVLLLPLVLADLVESLRRQRGQGEADPGVWAALDRETYERERERHESLQASAHAALYTALEHHARKPSHARVLEGLRVLEDLHAGILWFDPIFDAELLMSEGDELVEALQALLPPMARRLLSCAVEGEFRRELEDRGIIGPEATGFWFHRLPGVGVWRPVWRKLTFAGHDPLGIWFIPSVQEVYEMWHAGAKAQGPEESGVQERRQRETAVKQERQLREEADRKDQARQCEEEEAQNEERDRERLVEAEHTQQRIQVQPEKELECRGEAERVLEAESAERKEGKRRSRPTITPQDQLYWKRPPLDLESRWAETEWKRWCKSKGMSPAEFSEKEHEKFIRRLS